MGYQQCMDEALFSVYTSWLS